MKCQSQFSGIKQTTSICRLLKCFPNMLSFDAGQHQDVTTLSRLGKIFSRRHTEIFRCYFSLKTGFDSSCKLSPIFIKCQNLVFLEK